LYRDTVLGAIARLDFPCLNGPAVYIALYKAEIVPMRFSIEASKDTWRPEGCAALAPSPSVWTEWVDGQANPTGVLLSTRRTEDGYEAEAIAFFSDGGAPMLCYTITYDVDGLVSRVSDPTMASWGGGCFVSYGWKQRAAELRASPDSLKALAWIFLAPAFSAIGALGHDRRKTIDQAPQCAPPLWNGPLDELAVELPVAVE